MEMKSTKGDMEFEFDKDLQIGYEKEFEKCQGLPFLATPCCPCATCLLMGYFCCGGDKVIEERINGKHLKISGNNIEFTQDDYYEGLPFECNRIGRKTTTIPIDQVQDIAVHYPAGYATSCCGMCCVVENVVSATDVQTAGSTGRPELVLKGLKDVDAFRREILLRKRGGKDAQVIPSQAQPAWENAAPAGSMSPAAESELLDLAREQRDLLRSMNESLKIMAQQRSLDQ